MMLTANCTLQNALFVFLRYTKLGTAMRAMANDRDITATLGVPVRRVEAAAWLGCGLLGLRNPHGRSTARAADLRLAWEWQG